MNRKVVFALLFALSLSVSRCRAQTIEAVVAEHIRELTKSGNDITALRFLDRLSDQTNVSSTELTQLRIEIASRLMSVDGRTNEKIDATKGLEQELTASHPIFPEKAEDALSVSRKLENADKLFRDVLSSDGNGQMTIKRYASNQSISVKTSLKNHLKLILIARNPALSN